jgi:carbon storage regulator
MLVLAREAGESLMIGDDIEIHVVAVRGPRVRVAIDAPQHVRIHRKEVWLAIKAEAAERPGAEEGAVCRRFGCLGKIRGGGVHEQYAYCPCCGWDESKDG